MDIRLPVTADLHINAFSGGTITELESGITNGVVQTKNGKSYLTQRPSIDIFEDASDAISDAKGRGLFFWAENSILYIVNNDNLFKANQGASISSGLTAGTKRCYFFPIGGKIILLNPQSDEAFSVTTGDTVAAVSDGDFPSTLAAGGAVLNNALYVLTTAGVVHGSSSGDGTLWNALNFIGATRDPDGGVYLAKHHDNLAVFGPASLEFFYDAGNTSGSPLSRRQDVTWNIGCAVPESVWEIGDRTFFAGVDASGAIEFYLLENFQPRKISTPTIDSLLTNAVTKDSYTVVGSGFSGAGHDFYIVTFATVPDAITPETTLVYDSTVGLWYIWESDLGGVSKLPLVGWTKRDGLVTQYGQGQLANGDIININDDLNPTDTLLGNVYILDDYVDDGYVQSTSAAGTVITITSRTGMYDGKTNKYKYPESLRFVGDKTPSSQTLTIKWADENNSSFNSGRSQDISINSKEHRLGRFQRRNHEISYSGTDDIWVEGLEIPINAGSN
jgi:hypothetical protein